MARLVGAKTAILKARSPSCGSGKIYDGSFTGTLVDGNGVFAELCKQNGMEVRTEEEILSAGCRLYALKHIRPGDSELTRAQPQLKRIFTVASASLGFTTCYAFPDLPAPLVHGIPSVSTFEIGRIQELGNFVCIPKR